MQRASQDESVRYTDEASQRLSENISNSLDKAQIARTEMMHSLQEVEAYREAINQIQSNRTQYDVTLDQAFYEWLPQQPLGNVEQMGTNNARDIITKAPDMLGQYMQQFVSEKADTLLQENISGRQTIQDNYTAANLGKVDGIQQAYADSNRAIMNEIDSSGFERNSEVGSDLQTQATNWLAQHADALQNHAAGLNKASEPFKEDVSTEIKAAGQAHPATVAAKNVQDAVSEWWDKTTGLTGLINKELSKNKPE